MLFIIERKVRTWSSTLVKFELLRYRLRGSTVQNLAGYKSNIGSEIEEKTHVNSLPLRAYLTKRLPHAERFRE